MTARMMFYTFFVVLLVTENGFTQRKSKDSTSSLCPFVNFFPNDSVSVCGEFVNQRIEEEIKGGARTKHNEFPHMV